ncbi:MAG: hypothetical protein RJA19_301 [Bacteroidota bacterium]|jgi:four helix bundle protein
MFLFTKLRVYQLSLQLNEEVRGHVTAWESGRVTWGRYVQSDLMRQLTRAASSVALNIAEGQGRMMARDRRYFATVARGSLCEVVACLQILRADGALPEGQFDGLMGQATEVLGLLNGLIARPGGVASRAEAL